MRILIVSGIWPPDVGGPASHAPEIADALTARGHRVEVVTTAVSAPERRDYAIRHVSRALPVGARHAAVAALVARSAARADVVYATSMLGRSTVGATAARAPLVVKIAGDPAYERALRHGLYRGRLADFQRAEVGIRAASLRRWRTLAIRRAAHVVCPSAFLREIALSWGLPPDTVSVLPNAAPEPPAMRSRDELRDELGMTGPTIAFAGRLTRAKALDVAIDAAAQLDDVVLLIAGDGEERARLVARAPRNVRFLGALPRERVLAVLAAADAVALTSDWENFPHVLVEALAVGSPVVATAVGGVPEIVEDGVNGLLVPPRDATAFAAAVRRLVDDAVLRERLRANAARSVERFAAEHVLDRLEHILEAAAR
jgi:glycosyltransferase involved in cell wall biosynthesis